MRRIGESDGEFGSDRPGGWVCRTDPDGKSFELVAMGLRNPYDLAFNAEGNYFTFDSDMEWDSGTPWYRPTRINHVIDGTRDFRMEGGDIQVARRLPGQSLARSRAAGFQLLRPGSRSGPDAAVPRRDAGRRCSRRTGATAIFTSSIRSPAGGRTRGGSSLL